MQHRANMNPSVNSSQNGEILYCNLCAKEAKFLASKNYFPKKKIYVL